MRLHQNFPIWRTKLFTTVSAKSRRKEIVSFFCHLELSGKHIFSLHNAGDLISILRIAVCHIHVTVDRHSGRRYPDYSTIMGYHREGIHSFWLTLPAKEMKKLDYIDWMEWNSIVTKTSTCFCGHFTYIETLWKAVKWSMKWPYYTQRYAIEMFCYRHTFLLWPYIWSRVELFSETLT